MAPIARLAMAVLLFSATFINAAPLATTPDNEAGMAEFKRVVVRAAPGVKIVSKCTVPNTMAITFDDGPFKFTATLLKVLRDKKVKATFFINGSNNGEITTYKDVVKQAYKDGHQIASHTWDHEDLTTLTKAQINNEMTKLDNAVKKIIGVKPTYMRPPYGAVNDLVTKTVGAKYTIVLWDVDTNDWQHPDDISKSVNEYEKYVSKTDGKSGHIVLQHDTIQSTSELMAGQAIDHATKMGWKLVTVGECLGKPKSTWYRN
ncbi:hypothetical protein BGX23_009972 [Mortierella sp. AD031]|nr:hypothetical protein BGX23_009972 [Mortierella sp. AD031]KAG0202333.1 hypothetical protein BGX33_009773 [Mortierella sp. NVP41]